MLDIKKSELLNMETVAYYSGFGGIEVKAIDDDYMYCVSGTFAGKVTPHKLKIYYNSERPYIVYNGHRCCLDEFLRS